MTFDRLAGMLSAVGIILILTMIGWLGIAGPIWKATWSATPDQWLGFVATIAGSFITSIVASVAILFAWRGVMRQLRLTLMSREEDWLADRLPGMREALMICEQILMARRTKEPSQLVNKMFEEIYAIPYPTHHALPHVERLLPRTADELRKEVAGLFAYASVAAGSCEVVRNHSEIGDDRLVGERARVIDSLDKIERFTQHLESRIKVFEKRLPKLRAEIEAFFDR
jgi:hypothetical protein